VCKVADFGTSRFLEIAAHGTTVIGSPPYMAPEQFHGKAVFASDLYSLGVTMYQMLTGVLPYDTPAPADIDRLLRGELITAPRLKNPAISKRLNDIILQAMAPDVTRRYQRASDLLQDVLELRKPHTPRSSEAGASRAAARPATPAEGPALPRAHAQDSASPPGARFCWNCRKPLHARSNRCPFCSEPQ
jgi:serine/threonine protein kinase